MSGANRKGKGNHMASVRMRLDFSQQEIAALWMMVQDSSNVTHTHKPTRKALVDLAERIQHAAKMQCGIELPTAKLYEF